MTEQLFDALRRLGIFMVCAQTIVHFRPKETDEKYIKLLVSIMILVQLLFPLQKVFSSEEEITINAYKEWEAIMNAGEPPEMQEDAPMSLNEVLSNLQPKESEVVQEEERIKIDPIEKIEVGE